MKMKKMLIMLLFFFIVISVKSQLLYGDKNSWMTLTYNPSDTSFCLKIDNCSKKVMYINKKKSPFSRGSVFLLIGHESMPIGPQLGEQMNFLRISPLTTDSLIFKDNSLKSFFKEKIPIIEAIISVDYILLSKKKYIKDGIRYEDFKKRKERKVHQIIVTGYMAF